MAKYWNKIIVQNILYLHTLNPKNQQKAKAKRKSSQSNVCASQLKKQHLPFKIKKFRSVDVCKSNWCAGASRAKNKVHIETPSRKAQKTAKKGGWSTLPLANSNLITNSYKLIFS